MAAPSSTTGKQQGPTGPLERVPWVRPPPTAAELVLTEHPIEQSPDDLTGLVRRMRQGDPQAAAELLPKVYDQLHRLAQRAMHGQRADHTLQTTGLLNEAYLRLCSGSSDTRDRHHFLHVAARAMRSVLVDHTRRKRRLKRQATGERVLLDELVEAAQARSDDLLALDEALERLAVVDADMARLVDLRFFAGLSVAEAATVLGMSPRQAAREWVTARAWLRKELV